MINLPIDKSILDRCLDSYGMESEKMKTIQECSELIVALTRNMEGRESNVVEEVADVLIMASQMACVFGFDAVCTMIERKLEREIERLS